MIDGFGRVADDLGLPVVNDALPDSGSAVGVYTAVLASPTERVICVACDMPFLSVEVVRLVASRAAEADVVIPRIAGQGETLHACYAKACLGALEGRLRAGRLKVIGFFDGVRVLAITEAQIARVCDPAVVFMNVNTPDELDRARALAASLEAR